MLFGIDRVLKKDVAIFNNHFKHGIEIEQTIPRKKTSISVQNTVQTEIH